MKKKYPVVTLCGSTRFKSEFMQVQKELTLQGYIVISVGLFGYSGALEVWEGMDENTLTETKLMLDEMHKEKIRMSDEIFVVNPNGYIGESTWSEICYARMLNKPIRFMNDVDDEAIDTVVSEHIARAEKLASDQLDFIRHMNGRYNINEFAYFTYKGKIIVDPWINLEAHYNGGPWANHDDPAQAVDPFAYYGCEKTAGFIEKILMIARGRRLL